MTVVRLYYDNGLDNSKGRNSKSYAQMRSEYEYARDRLKIFARQNPSVMDEDGDAESMDPRKLSYWWPPSGFTIFFAIIMGALIYDYMYSEKKGGGLFGMADDAD